MAAHFTAALEACTNQWATGPRLAPAGSADTLSGETMSLALKAPANHSISVWVGLVRPLPPGDLTPAPA